MAPPTEQRKKPLDQNVRVCFPQYTDPNWLSTAEADWLFSAPTTSLGLAVGGYRRRKWIWSLSPPNSITLQLSSSAILRMLRLTKSSRSAVSVCLLNVVQNTKWTVKW